MNELLRNYQMNCLLTGKLRVVVLQKTIAAAVAYAAPCVSGTAAEESGYYSELCREFAYKAISQVNETILIDTDAVMSDIELIWKGRYAALNYPTHCSYIEQFHKSMVSYGSDVEAHYGLWIVPTATAAQSMYVEYYKGE